VGFRLSTFGAILSLLAAFIQAPCSHVHEHESTQHHAGSLLHTHFANLRVHHAAQPELRDLDPDDDAVFQQWFSATSTTTQVLSVVLSIAPVLPAPTPNEWLAETVQPNSHDPPELAIIRPRPPPA
jgi:hypothetical protein